METVEDRINAITIKAEQIPARPDTDFKEAIHWRLCLNDKIEVEYCEGIGHFINMYSLFYNKMVTEGVYRAILCGNIVKLDCSGGGLSRKEWRDYFKERVTWNDTDYCPKITITPPAIKDVLYSLQIDGDTINYSFEEWCDNYGYDTDSRKAHSLYQACIDNYRKIRALGFTLEELQEYFQDY